MAATHTATATVGVFTTREAAERAVADLRAAGYRNDEIGIVARDASGKTVRTDAAGDNTSEGMALGAAAGAGALGLGSLAVSFGVIPVIGPVLAVGPLAAALLSAAGGAAAGGLVGALVGWGVPEEDARFYEKEVEGGRYLVTVNADSRAPDVRAMYSRHGGYDRTNRGHAV